MMKTGQYLNKILLGRIILQLYINLIKVQSLLIPVWTCMHVLEGP